MERTNIKVYIFKRKGRSNYEAEFIDPRTGRKRRRSLGTPLKREAERIAGRIEKDLRDGQWRATRRVLWKDFRTRYETDGLLGRSKDTRLAFQTAANRLEEIVNPGTLQALSADYLTRFSSRLLLDGLSKYTVACYLRHLKAGLRWAVRQGLLMECPHFEMPKGASCGKAKGRAISTEEFERMLAQVPRVVGEAAAESWRFLLEGLWWSGLRLGEAVALSWNEHSGLMVDLNQSRPMLRIKADAEKGKRDRILPLAPEFADLLLKTPENERDGLVFKLKWRRNHGKPARVDSVSPVICEIGKKANVRVGDRKTASAHDLRRSFGLRWANRVKPHILQQLMRHSSIHTTMSFYVQSDADEIAETIWVAFQDMRNSSAKLLPAADRPKRKGIGQQP